MTPLISIIVPIYNVEKYLKKCVDSIIAQTYTNIEIILVDDGSPDNCGAICDEYEKKDNRIRVIHKKNGGLSDARNAGLDICRGEYISFIDSDDWVSAFYIENLYNAIYESGADMSISCVQEIYDGKKLNKKYIKNECIGLKVLDSKKCLQKLLYQDGIDTYAPAKLYDIQLFNKLRYPIGKLYEDVLVTVKTIANSSKITIVKNIDYFYFQRKTSIQYQAFDIRKMDAIKQMEKLVSFIEYNYPDLLKAVYCRMLSANFNILFQIPNGQYEDEKKKIITSIKENRVCVLFDKNARMKTKIAALLSFAGYKFVREVYKLTQKRGKIS